MVYEKSLNNMNLIPLHFLLKKWVEKAEAIGIISKGGRYGGEFAHTDIVFEFASWIFT